MDKNITGRIRDRRDSLIAGLRGGKRDLIAKRSYSIGRMKRSKSSRGGTGSGGTSGSAGVTVRGGVFRVNWEGSSVGNENSKSLFLWLTQENYSASARLALCLAIL